MTVYDYDRRRTGVLLVDPLNDFLADEGKLFAAHRGGRAGSRPEEPVSPNWCPPLVRSTCRCSMFRTTAGHRGCTSPFHPNPSQRSVDKHQLLADAFGGDCIPPLRPVLGHGRRAALGPERVRQHRPGDAPASSEAYGYVIVIGLLANTCIETTAKYAMELGFHVSLVTDAAAAYSSELMRAAHELNGPTYAHVITDTKSAVAALKT